MPKPPPHLPIDEVLLEIRATLRQHSSLVLAAPPGAGKSTRVPAAMLGEPWLQGEGSVREIVLLQPRRVAARAVAARIAEERNVRLGDEVGYQIRFENRTNARTQLRVVTEGILTRQLAADPFLERVGCVILDEFHERSIHIDLALALLREIQRTVRPELRIVVMSATLAAEPIAAYLGDAPVISSPGRMHPVQIEFLSRHDPAPIPQQAAAAIERVLTNKNEPGHMLVFLPGIGEIRQTAPLIQNSINRHNIELHILHSSIAPAAQQAALDPSTRRKLILATNIAETSLTIDGVTTVIDSGYARVALQDPRLGIDRLELRRISQASAAQRTGRAGRTAPGHCLRLWTRAEDATLPSHETPEIQRVDLSPTLLAIKHFGFADAIAFPWFEAPRPDASTRAEQLLHWLGVCNADGTLTKFGRTAAQLPVAPRLGVMLIAGAQAGLLREAATLAALLHEGEALPNPTQRRQQARIAGQSDLIDRLDEFIQATPNFERAREQFARAISTFKPVKSARQNAQQVDPNTALRRLLLRAYPDRVTLRRSGDPNRGLMVGGRGITLEPVSIVRDAPLFLSLDPREPPPQARNQADAVVSLASAIESDWLMADLPHLIRAEMSPQWDATRQRVFSAKRTFYIDLLIEEKITGAAANDPTTNAKLAEALISQATAIISNNPATSEWLARVELLRRHMPDLALPAFDSVLLTKIFTDACSGKTSRAELEALNWRDLLEAHLTHQQRTAFARDAPETLGVPSGSRIRISYAEGNQPVLAARLQELFGWAETPRIAAGRVPVLLHLLGPNRHPVQVTSDLKNFWNTTYKEVRKDLRARYPKHPWPEDPWNAPAVAVGRRRK